MSTLILHAVTRSSENLPDVEAAGRRFSWLKEGVLAALVSEPAADAGTCADAEIFADAEAIATLALLHHDILSRLARSMDLVPVTLGALFSGADAVLARLAAQSASFLSALGRIEGRAEFAVKLTETAPATAAPVSAESGRGYLSALRARKEGVRADTVARARFAMELRQMLARQAVSFRDRPARPDPSRRVLIDLACLAPRGSETLAAILRESIGPKAEALGLSLRIEGPWPPYSFIAEAA
jgi:hypothetical protein